MPTFDDYHGAIFTLQSLRLNNDLKDVELLVIDNNPSSPGSAMLKGNLEGPLRGDNAGARYIAYEEAVGPANTKNRVFAEANGKAVLCIDSHVLFRPGTINKLIDWYDKNPDSKDLICGPLVYDDLYNISTHFDDVWRGEMWGIWGTAWVTFDGIAFSILNKEDKTVAVRLDKGLGHHILEEYSNIPFNGHDRVLKEKGCTPIGRKDTDQFEIPGNGCGLISCHKDAWLTFNVNFAGFGGEEMYIHEKFRQAGHKAYCLGFLKWWHRFGRPEGVKFPLRRDQKVRNYIIGHLELGLPLEPVFEHFVKSGLMPEREWQILKGHASIGMDRKPTEIKVGGETMVVEETKAPVVETTLETLFKQIKGIPRDLDKHMDMFASLAGSCPRVTEFSDRRESFIGLAYGMPSKIISYNTERDNAAYRQAMRLLPPEVEVISMNEGTEDVSDIDETDLLFIDKKHTGEAVYSELTKYAPKVTTYILLHDTELYGVTGEDKKPGLWVAVKKFLKENPDWFIAFHTPMQYGMTALSKQEKHRPVAKVAPWNANHGPGTELKNILESLGINSGPSCDCNARAKQMNVWGVEGCKERREEIYKWIIENQERWGWKDKVKKAADDGVEIDKPVEPKKTWKDKFKVYWKTVSTGLIFKLDVSDPVGSLIDLSIQRAEIKEKNGEYNDDNI